ncbi:unnamed protein product [Closterium sp. NIES-53]
MAQSALSATASLCAAPSTAVLPLAGASAQVRRNPTKRAPYSLHIRASTNPSSSSSSSPSSASASASAPASAAFHPLARSLTAAAAAVALVLLPAASLGLPQPALALSERERYEQLDSNFLSSPILQQLLKQSEENRERNRQEIENKYCLRGAGMS